MRNTLLLFSLTNRYNVYEKGYDGIIYIFILEEYNIKQFQCYMMYCEDITYYLTTAKN